MEIITTAAAATAAMTSSNSNANTAAANASYSKSLMASRALQNGNMSSEVNITQLEKGDVFKGEITNMTGRSVTVSLGSGQTLSAMLQDNVPINIGNHLYFEVLENTGDKVIIHPLTDEKFSPQNQTIEKSLQSAGLQLNEKNMAVVKELMDAGMPIDRNSIMKVLQQLVNHPNAPISTVVSLLRVDMPVTDANINQLQQYQAHNSQLNSQMDSVMDGVSATFESLGEEGMSSSEILRFNQLVVDTFTTPVGDQALTTLALKDAFVMDDIELEDFALRQEMMEMDGDGNPVLDVNGNVFPKGSVVMDVNGMPVVDSNGNFAFSEEFINQMQEENPDLSRDQILAGLRNGEFSMSNTSAFANEIQGAFAEQLRGIGVNEEAIKMMLDPENTAEDLMKSLQDYLNNSSLSEENIKQFLSSKEYTVLVESVIENNWKLTPEQLKEPQKVDDLFTRIAEQSAKLATAGDGGFSSAGDQMGQNSQNMHENLQFMQDMNEKYTFAQIPLQLQNQDANSELYVYTNKKTLHKDKKDCSVLLHLDMDNLGSTDIHVQLNGTKVMARFYLDDNRSMATVQSHMDQLQGQIEKLGLSLDTEVVRRAETKKQEVEDIVDDFMAKDIPASQQIKRYTFDMRA